MQSRRHFSQSLRLSLLREARQFLAHLFFFHLRQSNFLFESFLINLQFFFDLVHGGCNFFRFRSTANRSARCFLLWRSVRHVQEYFDALRKVCRVRFFFYHLDRPDCQFYSFWVLPVTTTIPFCPISTRVWVACSIVWIIEPRLPIN